jgi:putative ABC transport system permease protein
VTLLIGALTLGLIMALLALGVYVSFRIFATADITVDGSLTFGAAVAAVLIVGYGYNPIVASLAGFAAGVLAGCATGVLQTRFGINSLLAGILVMTALYSVNLRIMGRSNVPFLGATTLPTWCGALAQRLFGTAEVNLAGWTVNAQDLVLLAVMAVIVAGAAAALYWFFRTDLGTAMRAAGDNPQMISALGVDVGRYRIIGLALSNGLVGLSGALWAQYQNFADAQMGIGMIVWGLASVIIGEALTGAPSLGYAVIGALLGSILFRLLVAIALGFGLNPNDLKLITAVFVFIALVLPGALQRLKLPASKKAATFPPLKKGGQGGFPNSSSSDTPAGAKASPS